MCDFSSRKSRTRAKKLFDSPVISLLDSRFIYYSNRHGRRVELDLETKEDRLLPLNLLYFNFGPGGGVISRKQAYGHLYALGTNRLGIYCQRTGLESILQLEYDPAYASEFRLNHVKVSEKIVDFEAGTYIEGIDAIEEIESLDGARELPERACQVTEHLVCLYNKYSESLCLDRAYRMVYAKIWVKGDNNGTARIVERTGFTSFRKSQMRTKLRQNISDQPFLDFMGLDCWYEPSKGAFIDRDFGAEMENIRERLNRWLELPEDERAGGDEFREVILKFIALGTPCSEFLDEVDLVGMLEEGGFDDLCVVYKMFVNARSSF